MLELLRYLFLQGLVGLFEGYAGLFGLIQRLLQLASLATQRIPGGELGKARARQDPDPEGCRVASRSAGDCVSNSSEWPHGG